jgi:Flp pilus assembly protein TadG
MFEWPRRFVRRFFQSESANVVIIFALSVFPIVFLVGLGMDFTIASQKKLHLDAAADAAALSAVTPQMANQTVAATQAYAQQVFNGEASTLTGVSYSQPAINIVQNGLVRTATVSYTASSTNAFAGILGKPTWPIAGTSVATSQYSPNVDFYLLLDNSPSMAIAATSAGISTMVSHTSAQGGCAFACHESNPAADNLGNPGGIDNYQYAKNLGVVTRIQNVAKATAALMTTASQTEAQTNAQYRMAIYTFNTAMNTIQTLTSNLSTAATAAQGIDVQLVYQNNWLTKTNQNNDTDTNFTTPMQQINGIMPNPGTGLAGSSPQEVLFLVTDGVEDKVFASCSEPKSGTRCQQPFDTSWCTTIKNRGIFIAVLYTEYLPLPTNSWYNQWVAPFQNQISPNIKSCATPGLFFQITTDGDITAAMAALFQTAITEARLAQ